MVKKQSTPRQFHILQEVKRKAQADQEARLQQALHRLSQQNTPPSTVNLQSHSSVSHNNPSFKYYAVRRGRTWLECKAQVHQFPGAEYKSFLTYIEAQNNLSIGTQFIAVPTLSDHQAKTIVHQAYIPIPIQNQIPRFLPKKNHSRL
jgi:hypothetical protein